MAFYARKKVSKKKRRYEQDGFDLDLAYITPNIIAMGFPSIGKEALYRNPLPEVYRFFETKHKDHYKLYNLCAEKEYDIEKFHKRVSRYPFYDHNAPRLQLIADCCQDISDWLKKDDQNIVGINCKAGKGRTGLIICCFLLFSGQCADTQEALTFYGNKRTKDGKGVTIASQQRYIRYYEYCLKNLKGLVPKSPRLVLEKLIITTIPKIAGPQHVEIEIDNVVCFKSKPVTPKKGEDYEIPVGGEVEGDCKIQLWVKTERLCHFWINTGFYQSETKLLKDSVDVANKDTSCAIFKKDFGITPTFTVLKKASESGSDEDKKPILKEDVADNSNEKDKKPKKSTSADSSPEDEEKKPKKVSKRSRNGENEKKDKEAKKEPKDNEKKDKEATKDDKEAKETDKKEPEKDKGTDKSSSKKSMLVQSSGVKRDRDSARDSEGRKRPNKSDPTPKPPKPTRDSKAKSPKPSRNAEPVVEPTVQVSEPAPTIKPASPTNTQASSPRTRESFYKYSDYKEVIEKIRSGGDTSDDDDEDESDQTVSSSEHSN